MSKMISRTRPIDSHVGRTLEGVAFFWDDPVKVSDDGRVEYLEEYAPECVDRTLADRAKLAVGILHPWSPPEKYNVHGRTSPVPVGAVEFHRSREALLYTAKISRTGPGDDALELIQDGALGDVSIGAYPIREKTRASRMGPVVRRIEIALRELSLAPPGMGSRPEAKVLVVRSAVEVDADVVGTPFRDHAEMTLRVLRSRITTQ